MFAFKDLVLRTRRTELLLAEGPEGGCKHLKEELLGIFPIIRGVGQLLFKCFFFLLSSSSYCWAHPVSFLLCFAWFGGLGLLYFSVLKFQFVSIAFISLLRLSIFSFVSSLFIIAPWSIFRMAILKSSSNNSNICVISVLASVDYLFSSKLGFFWFLVWWVPFS